MIKKTNEPWMQEVEKRTNGSIKVTLYPGASLFSASETIDSIINGVADIGWSYSGYSPARFPLAEFALLPLDVNSSSEILDIYWALYDKYPEIREEWSGVKLLWVEIGARNLFMTKTKVSKLEDMKGLKIKTSGGIVQETIKALGAVPVSMTPPDTYLAMEKGVVDGAMMGWDAMQDWNLKDVAPYVIEAYPFNALFYCIMNEKTWNSLSPEEKAVIDELSKDMMRKIPGQAWDENIEKIRAQCISEGTEVVELTGQEKARWQERYQTVMDIWLKTKQEQGKGDIAKEILDTVNDMIK